MQHIEDNLQRAVCRLLDCYENAGDLMYFAVPNGGKRNKVTAKILKGIGVKAGVSDLVIVLPGRVLFVELKAPKGRQSQTQKDFAEKVQSFKHEYHLCRTIFDVKRLVKSKIRGGA